MHRAPKPSEVARPLENDGDPLKLRATEEVCLNRCISKVMNVKEIVDSKLLGKVELPPILFNQNLP
jgi:hypothetical protein